MMNYLKTYNDFYDTIEPLTDAECGRLFRAMLLYSAGRLDNVEFPGNERFLWPTARTNIDRVRKEVEKKAASGRTGGLVSGNRRKQDEATASDTKQDEATASDTKQDEATASDTKLKRKEIKRNEKKRNISAYADTPFYPPMGKEGKDEPASVPEAERFSPVMQSAVNDWLAYKAEKRQAYRPEGLKAFFAKAESNVRKYGEDAVVDAIRQSMAANYQGVVWDKAAGQSRASTAQSGDGWTYAGQRRYGDKDLAGIAIPLDGMGEPSAAMQDDSGHPSDTGEVSAGDRPAPGCGSFAEFWAAYPRRVAKAEAENAWNKLKPDAELLTAMLSAVEKAKDSRQWQEEGGKYIPYPATWLSQRRWEDDLEPAANVGRMDNLQRLYAEFEAEAAEG